MTPKQRRIAFTLPEPVPREALEARGITVDAHGIPQQPQGRVCFPATRLTLQGVIMARHGKHTLCQRCGHRLLWHPLMGPCRCGCPQWGWPAAPQAACALCAAPTPEETISDYTARARALPSTYCQCGRFTGLHAAQHPHGCASSGCPGWRAREEETHG